MQVFSPLCAVGTITFICSEFAFFFTFLEKLCYLTNYIKIISCIPALKPLNIESFKIPLERGSNRQEAGIKGQGPKENAEWKMCAKRLPSV